MRVLLYYRTLEISTHNSLPSSISNFTNNKLINSHDKAPLKIHSGTVKTSFYFVTILAIYYKLSKTVIRMGLFLTRARPKRSHNFE